MSVCGGVFCCALCFNFPAGGQERGCGHSLWPQQHKGHRFRLLAQVFKSLTGTFIMPRELHRWGQMSLSPSLCSFTGSQRCRDRRLLSKGRPRLAFHSVAGPRNFSSPAAIKSPYCATPQGQLPSNVPGDLYFFKF